MTAPQQPISVNIQTGAGEVLRIVATLLMFGGVGMLLWTLAQGPLAEAASIVGAAASAFFVGQLWRRGVIGVPAAAGLSTGPRSVAAAANAVRGTFLRTCAIGTLLAIALGYGVAFLAVRGVIEALLAAVVGETVADYASIALTGAMAFLVAQLWERSTAAPVADTAVPVVADGDDGDDIALLRSTAADWTATASTFLRTCHVAILAGVSLVYGIGLIGVREVVASAMGLFQNLYIAGGAALVVGSLVVMPSLMPNVMRSLRRSGVVRTVETQPTVQVAAHPAPAPAPVPTPVPAPVETPAPAPTAKRVMRVKKVAPAKKVVVRRIVKKENNDV